MAKRKEVTVATATAARDGITVPVAIVKDAATVKADATAKANTVAIALYRATSAVVAAAAGVESLSAKVANADESALALWISTARTVYKAVAASAQSAGLVLGTDTMALFTPAWDAIKEATRANVTATMDAETLALWNSYAAAKVTNKEGKEVSKSAHQFRKDAVEANGPKFAHAVATYDRVFSYGSKAAKAVNAVASGAVTPEQADAMTSADLVKAGQKEKADKLPKVETVAEVMADAIKRLTVIGTAEALAAVAVLTAEAAKATAAKAAPAKAEAAAK